MSDSKQEQEFIHLFATEGRVSKDLFDAWKRAEAFRRFPMVEGASEDDRMEASYARHLWMNVCDKFWPLVQAVDVFLWDDEMNGELFMETWMKECGLFVDRPAPKTTKS
jgi:hypothetical protein